MTQELLQLSNVSNMKDIPNLFMETIAEFTETGLDAELSEEQGYSKYNYKNNDTDNSRSGYSLRNAAYQLQGGRHLYSETAEASLNRTQRSEKSQRRAYTQSLHR